MQSSSPRDIQPSPRLVRYGLTGQKDSLNPSVWRAVSASIHSTNATAALEIYLAEDNIQFVLASDHESTELLTRAIAGALGGVLITPFHAPVPQAYEPIALALERPNAPFWTPLTDAEDFKDIDPLAALLESVQPLESGEQVLVRFLCRPARADQYQKAYQAITRAMFSGTIWDLVALLAGNLPRGPRFEAHLQRVLEERLKQPLFDVVGQVALLGPDRTRLESRAESLASALWGQFNAGFGGIHLRPRDAEDKANPPSLLISAGELAALWHLPSEKVTTPGITFLKHAPSVLPPALLEPEGIALGLHSQRGQAVAVYLSRRDLDAGHLICLGRTGVGKSTLMHQLLSQLAAQPDRPGVWVIDPHSDLVHAIALQGIAKDRWDDVVLIDLSDADFPIGLPFFAAPEGVSTEAMIQTTFSLLRSIFREHWSETRMADTVFALTATLCALPNATLLDAPRLFSNAAFRRQATQRLTDPVALEFWSDFGSLSPGAQREFVRPVLYRLRSFYRSAAVRNLVCRNDGPDFADLLDKIVLVALNGAEVQAESDLLGELLIARLHLAALSRLQLPSQLRRHTYLACDESQRFKGASLPNLLSEGRKLGVALLLSTQFIDGWSEALAQAVMGNAGTTIAFRCSPNDARRLTNTMRPFTSEQLEDLNRYQALVKLQAAGITIPAFDIATLPPNALSQPAALDHIQSRTRERYARPRKEVEDEIQAAHFRVMSPDSPCEEENAVNED